LWLAGGGAKDALSRATGLWQQALRDYEEQVMDSATREALGDYVTHRKEEIGTKEP